MVQDKLKDDDIIRTSGCKMVMIKFGLGIGRFLTTIAVKFWNSFPRRIVKSNSL